MATVGRERLEFVTVLDPEPAGRPARTSAATDHTPRTSDDPTRVLDDVLALDPPPVHRPRPRRVAVLAAVAAVTIPLAVGLVGRAAGDPGPAPSPTADWSPVGGHLGVVALPPSFGTPRALAAAGAGRDQAWAVGDGGWLVALRAGLVQAARNLGVPVAAVAADPQGRWLVAATGGATPSLVRLDPQTLHTLGEVPLVRPGTGLAAEGVTLWVAGAGRLVAVRTDTWTEAASWDLPDDDVVTSLRAVGTGGPMSVLAVVVSGPAGSSVLAVTTTPVGGPDTTVDVAGPWPAPVTAVATAGGVWVAHDDGAGAVTVAPVGPDLSHVDAAAMDPATSVPLADPLAAGATVWPGGTSTAWAAATPGSNTLPCFDSRGRAAGRTTVGDDGTPVVGPVVRAAGAFYAVDARARLVRAAAGSCP